MANEESNILALANNAHLYIPLRVMCGPCGAGCFALTACRETGGLPATQSFTQCQRQRLHDKMQYMNAIKEEKIWQYFI